jgi:carboxymethylenebutenolidase
MRRQSILSTTTAAAAVLTVAVITPRAQHLQGSPPSPSTTSSRHLHVETGETMALGSQDQAPRPAPQPADTVDVPEDDRLPPPDARARASIAASPRHAEWAEVSAPGEREPLRTWIVYPERKDKAPVVIVIHEIFGLSEWIRAVADQLAQDGFIAIAPDLISGKGPNGGGTESVPSRDDVTKLVLALSPAEVTSRLDGVRQYALGLPAASGKIATLGFCWGGSTSFAYATTQASLDAAVVFYGASPDPSALSAVRAPVLGLYGGDDARVNVTIEPARAELTKLGKTYEPRIFDGAGHGFLRVQEGRGGANLAATRQAWPATVAFLNRHLQ